MLVLKFGTHWNIIYRYFDTLSLLNVVYLMALWLKYHWRLSYRKYCYTRTCEYHTYEMLIVTYNMPDKCISYVNRDFVAELVYGYDHWFLYMLIKMLFSYIVVTILASKRILEDRQILLTGISSLLVVVTFIAVALSLSYFGQPTLPYIVCFSIFFFCAS